MVFDKKTWVDRQSQYPNRRTLTDVSSGTTQVVEVARNEGTVSVTGHPFNASNMNDLEDRIEGAVDALQENFQAGVDSVYDACADKGSTPASHALVDVVEAIENISGGGAGANMFGTPDSDNPEGGEITTSTEALPSHEAYKAFGNNLGWISDASGFMPNDDLCYEFTNGLAYQPSKIQFCNNFRTSDGAVVRVQAYDFQGSNNGTDWVSLAYGIIDTGTEGNVVTIDITGSNEYFSQFKMSVTSEPGYYAGLKNFIGYGYVKEGGGVKIVPFIWHERYMFATLTQFNRGLPPDTGKYYFFIGCDSGYYEGTEFIQITQISNCTRYSQIGNNLGDGTVNHNVRIGLYLVEKTNPSLESVVDYYFGTLSQWFPLCGNPTIGQVTQVNDLAENTFTLNFNSDVCVLVVGLSYNYPKDSAYWSARFVSISTKHYLCAQGTVYGDGQYWYMIYAVENDGTNIAEISIDDNLLAHAAYMAFPISFAS